ncbi:ATP-binding protein [Eubacteriales bacterium OttesenSCG-928-K08]|nr:ATP-binding protein [Eubacteriales bacterium OttesenSCG-928-K08]
MSGHVSLTFPAKPEFLVTARLVAGSIAGQAGFDVDDIEDVKTACSEACLMLMGDAGAKIEMELWKDEEQEGIRARICAPVAAQTEQTAEMEIGMFLLEALVDEVSQTEQDNMRVFEIFKMPLA